MELKRIEIENFMGIGQGAVDFGHRAGITLIKGENNDSPSSVSNGAGKSSVFEALFWALYGKTKRGATGDAVINRSAKKDCRVTLYFDNYKLVRSRKPNELTLHELDFGKSSSVHDLTKGTIKETQELIDNIIKISELTFSKIAYFGQEDVKSFASLTDAELKKVFEQALGLTFLSDHHEKAKLHLSQLRNRLLAGQQQIAQFDMEIKETMDKIAILDKAVKDLAERRESEQLRIIADIGQDEADLAAIKKKYIENQALAKQSKAEIDALSVKLNELRSYHKKLDTQRDNQRHLYGLALAEVSNIKNTGNKLQERITKLPDMVGQACGECKRPYSAEDMKNVAESLKDQIRLRAAEYKLLSEKSEGMKIQVDQIEAVMAKLNEALEAQQKSVNVKLATTNPQAIQSSLLDQERHAGTLVKRIEDNQRVLVKLASEDASYAREITEKRGWIEDREMEKSLTETEIAKLQNEFDTAELLVDVLGNAGMKSYIFDSVTPELNREINQFARMLDDIAVEVSTVTRLKSGEYREKFHIKVENEHGAEEFCGNSGGEKQKVNLAVALGFNKVFRAMSEGAVNAVFLDEPFESLDKGSSEAVIELCKAFTGVGNVFVITHQDAIKDLITDVITVQKNGKKAVIK